MTPYYEGTSEAEHLIRGSPELVEPWLVKARQDRKQWMVRWFHAQKREFLDGFINSLEHYLANRKASLEPVVDAFASAEVTPPALADGVVDGIRPQACDETSAADVEETPGSASLDVETRGVEVVANQETASPLLGGAEARAESEAEAALVETTGALEQADHRPDRQEIEPDAETELALGVMKLSGWTIDVDPQANMPAEGDDLGATDVVDFPAQTGGPVPSVAWNRVFEQARGVGMVDLSAYDFIDGLGELRELIDHWQNLHQDPTAGDAP